MEGKVKENKYIDQKRNEKFQTRIDTHTKSMKPLITHRILAEHKCLRAFVRACVCARLLSCLLRFCFESNRRRKKNSKTIHTVRRMNFFNFTICQFYEFAKMKQINNTTSVNTHRQHYKETHRHASTRKKIPARCVCVCVQSNTLYGHRIVRSRLRIALRNKHLFHTLYTKFVYTINKSFNLISVYLELPLLLLLLLPCNEDIEQ